MRITYGCVRLLAFRIRGAAIRINPEEIDRIHESAIIVDVACQINPIPCDHVGRTNSIQVVDVDIVAKPVTLNAEDPRLAHCTSAHSRACRAVVVKECHSQGYCCCARYVDPIHLRYWQCCCLYR